MSNSPIAASRQAYRARLLSFSADPAIDEKALHWFEDGLLLIEGGRVLASGGYQELASQLLPDDEVQDLRPAIIMPGFIDSHVHYPQTDIIASPAEGLLPWLNTYTFPAERRFADPVHAARVAEFFLDELISNGTTSAMVYCTVHPSSVEAFFQASQQRNLRMIAGKVLMDRHCPDFLQDTAEQGVADSLDLLQRWHGKGRQLYAITPRFACTSSPAQMQLAGELAAAHPEVYLQTHVAENKAEIDWAMSLYPEARSYLDIYERYQMLRPRAMYGHCIWLDQQDRLRLRETGAAAAVCPSSNLFLGSGLFDFAEAQHSGFHHGLASDVGGGTSFSMLRTMNQAYKVARLHGHHLSATRMFYLATLGAAQALGLQQQIGQLQAGAEADFICLNPDATALLGRRCSQANSLEELLFALALLADDRCIERVYIAGQRQK